MDTEQQIAWADEALRRMSAMNVIEFPERWTLDPQTLVYRNGPLAVTAQSVADSPPPPSRLLYRPTT